MAYPGGTTALCTLALLSAGADADDTAVKQALEYSRTLDEPRRVYVVALQTMVFCHVGAEQDRSRIERNVRWLEQMQISKGPNRGAWPYGRRQGSGDPSNSRFAILALAEAARKDVKIASETWRRALDYWLRKQKNDGSWGYYDGHPATGSMTCAGIASVTLAAAHLSGDKEVAKQRQLAVSRGFEWLAQNFSVGQNPSAGSVITQRWLYYYLHALERAGRVTETKSLGKHDWLREVAEMLLARQDPIQGCWVGTPAIESNPVVATSLAILVLSNDVDHRD